MEMPMTNALQRFVLDLDSKVKGGIPEHTDRKCLRLPE